MANYRLTQPERLCGKTRIDALFSSGDSFIVYPYRVVYRLSPHKENIAASILVSVPKRNFKRAVKRNLIRRRIKEAYRKNKHILTEGGQIQETPLDIAILYIDKEVNEYQLLEKKLKILLQKLKEKVCTNTDKEESSKAKRI